jgi:hypothetical protein
MDAQRAPPGGLPTVKRWDLPHRLRAWSVPALVLVLPLLAGACQEKLAAPADCPALCPGGYELVDTLLDPIPGGDTAFAGYQRPGQGSGLRVSTNFPPGEDRAVLRFTRRPDSLLVADSNRAYTIDSVVLEVSVLYRDPDVTNLRLFFYRLWATVDSTVTFTDLDTAFTTANIVDSIAVDSAGRIRTVLSGTALSRVDIPAADSGVLALGVAIRADQGTGIRIGNAATASLAPSFTTFVQVATGDTTVPRSIARTAQFSTFRTQTPEVLDPDLLTLGGVPSARAVVRFPWPEQLRDSAQLVRVSLELLPVAPIPGIPHDTALIVARPVLADFGSKSPPVTDAFFAGIDTVVVGQTDTVRVEVLRAAQVWQGRNPRPPVLLLQLSPEVSSYTRPSFGSTRTPGFAPRLRVTYARPFPFERP